MDFFFQKKAGRREGIFLFALVFMVAFFWRKWYLFGCFLGEILEMVLGCFLDLASLFRLEGNED